MIEPPGPNRIDRAGAFPCVLACRGYEPYPDFPRLDESGCSVSYLRVARARSVPALVGEVVRVARWWAHLAFPAAGSDRVPAGARARWGLLPPPRGGFPQFRRTVGSERESGVLIMSGHEEAWPRGASRLVPRSSVTRARLSNPSWASLRFARCTDGPTSSDVAQEVFTVGP